MATPEQSKARRRSGIQKIHDYLGGCCVVCGSRVNIHIDHVDPTLKVYNPSHYYYLPWLDLLLELDKCQLLCQKHHLEKSKSDGSKVSGEKIASSKLTADKVKLIRQRHSNGESQAQIGRDLNISRQNVSLIVNGQTWKELAASS